ncbi:hypothetical protein MCHI_000365 [Candidatus Magnetoovum chiemensis]|jgi:hypothetical protein|nr:hypothetical protein MCHI_000365 [Candidatus Magnetoovum chiemensis]
MVAKAGLALATEFGNTTWQHKKPLSIKGLFYVEQIKTLRPLKAY